MTREVIRGILTFLQRTSLQPSEIPLFNTVVVALQEELKDTADTEKGKEKKK